MPNYNPLPLAILSDFDGTIVPFNVFNAILECFGGPECEEITRRWDMGEISQKEEYALGLATVSASKAEMETLLREVPIDPDFPRFVDLCRQRDIPLAVASDGLRWYIEYILHNHGVHGVQIYACEITFHNPGYSVSFPHFDPAHPLRGIPTPGFRDINSIFGTGNCERLFGRRFGTVGPICLVRPCGIVAS